MLTLTLKIHNQNLDIMVRPDQRMTDVLQVLKETGRIYFVIDKIIVYSVRKKEYINKLLTFRQAKIYTGDILELR